MSFLVYSIRLQQVLRYGSHDLASARDVFWNTEVSKSEADQKILRHPLFLELDALVISAAGLRSVTRSSPKRLSV